ncbi:MAG TPA: ABC transporter ATP-binding protein [Dehalococcoidia bacterium]|jgi:ABC-2 type transport system ATP-binding protein|nr:ABC transporter ATP-binding protein [Chloroflexota bacterium]MDP6055887.1 ABC transporter ATP-binding protein [Dehalococcoidia bacterium]MDP7261915.1 ABC transporter ATP-binding protein [Dehalococcoidia bacterium]MDP7485260.1 ABC transporter ATP-binding protein [Dehalococcoidia bacterium]HJP27384.1 ABC transporter ATP-binding protein [Dehalococcoidia bacterium]|tara:strand:- start:6208 stop:6975 length:768 start_codon:yes stop_codon:yes gene_type:complete
MTAATNPVIVAKDLRKKYEEITAVNGISFEVRRGEVFGMLGPNGAGKTTTIEILEGMRDADSGDAIINGINVKDDPTAVKTIIGVQLQQNAFFDNLKLAEIVNLYAKLYLSVVDPVEVLSRVGLDNRKNAKYAELSGGQKQRLSIAVALVNDPVVLFLDEPTTGLDPQARRQLWELVRTIQKSGATIVLTTHYMEEAEELCDRIAVVENGEIIALDTPDALIDQLLATGFKPERRIREATLDDVFLNLTGRDLRD